MSTPLTTRQREVLGFIVEYMRAHQYPPTTREIGVALGIISPNGVVANLQALERKGVIALVKGSARAIRVLGLDHCVFCGAVHSPTEANPNESH